MIQIHNVSLADKTSWQKLFRRAQEVDDAKLTKDVLGIVHEVKSRGDQALFVYAKQFDDSDISTLMVTKGEVENAHRRVSAQEISSITAVIKRIQNYHLLNKPHDTAVDTQDGVCCHKIFKPINSVGLYVPGGSAPLISTLMMLAIPAKVAGCGKISICTPVKQGKIHPLLLVTADLCGVDRIYKLGGAQAIAAMAYGSESINKVNKIYGPGNSWVTKAKMLVAHDVEGAAIDMPAGPSEVLVIADDLADASFVAADLLAQAEHGVDSQAILITTSMKVAVEVVSQVLGYLKTFDLLERQDILKESLKHSSILVVNTLDEALILANEYAPEHLILQIKDAEKYVDKVHNAGAVFVGKWAAEALGDYVTGSNHVLPTYGFAKSYSGLSTIDFMKSISVQYVTKEGLTAIGDLAMQIAQIEGLSAHKLAVEVRRNTIKD